MHIKSLDPVFREAYRILKPGGEFLLTNINQKKAPKLSISNKDQIVIESFYHPPKTVVQALESAFFHIQKEETVSENGVWINHIIKAKKLTDQMSRLTPIDNSNTVYSQPIFTYTYIFNLIPMNTIKKLGISMLGLVILTSFAGCGFGDLAEPDKPAAEVINTGIANLVNLQSAEFNLVVNSEGSSPEQGDSSMSFTIEGLVDSQDQENPLFSLAIDMSGTVDGQKGALEAEMRFVDSDLYALLSKFDFEGAEEAVGPYIGKWWKVPADMGLNESIPLVKGLTDEQKTMIEDLSNAELFTDITYVGSDKVDGMQSYHYSGTINPEAFKDLMSVSSPVAGLDEGLQNLELTGDVWIGSEDMTLKKMAVQMSNEVEGTTVDMDIVFELSSVNETLSLESPADAEDLDPMMLLPLMMMGSGLGGTPTGDTGDMNIESDLMDGMEADIDSTMDGGNTSE